MPYAAYETPFERGWIEYSGDRVTATGLPTCLPPSGVAAAPGPAGVVPAAVADLARSLGAFFSGRGPLPEATPFIGTAATTDLGARIYERVAAIPSGETMTYAQVADAVGAPGAARAVGAAMARNLFAPIIPCHRVVGSDGSLRGYAGGIDMKQRLLQIEACHG